MRNFLITASIVWLGGFAIAGHVAGSVESKLDSFAADRNAQLCQVDARYCTDA